MILNLLDEAIKYHEQITKIEEQACFLIPEEDGDYENHKKCAAEHRQIAEWLKELKELRKQTRWISCSERLPKTDKELIQ